jgi:hypothetical protein
MIRYKATALCSLYCARFLSPISWLAQILRRLLAAGRERLHRVATSQLTTVGSVGGSTRLKTRRSQS